MKHLKCFSIAPWPAMAVMLFACSSSTAPTSEPDCARSNGGCHAKATCTMEQGAPVCACLSGYEGNGIDCQDKTQPIVAISTPAEGQVFSLASDKTQEVTGTIEDVDLKEALIRLDGAPGQAVQVTDGAFKFAVSLAEEDNAVHHIEIIATDASSNSTSVSRSFVVDRVPPTLTIAAPSIDAVCAGVCTGAVINALSGPDLEFAGIATDRGGLDTASLTATLDEAILEVSGSEAWTADWTSIPVENGQFHTFVVSASDQAGNKGEARRIVYVDRVQPQATILVAGKRLVNRTAPLVEFSEPMDAVSVGLALTFSPNVTSTIRPDAEGKRFAFEAPSDLAAYEVYSLQVGASAKDRAGNLASPPAIEKFLTEAVRPTDWPGERPPDRLATDADGNPYAVVVEDGDCDGNQCAYDVLWSWNGRDAFHRFRLPYEDNGYERGFADSLAVSSAVDADLRLNAEVGVGAGWICGSYDCGLPMIAFSWTKGPVLPATPPALSFHRFVRSAFARTALINKYEEECVRQDGNVCATWRVRTKHTLMFPDPSDAKQIRSIADPQVNLTTATSYLTSQTQIRGWGGAAIANDKVVYLPNKYAAFSINDSTVAAAPESSIPIFGLQQRRGISASTGRMVPVGAAVVAWAERVVNTAPPAADYSALYLACSNNESSSWKKSPDLSPIPSSDRYSGTRIINISMASSDNTLAIAVATSRSQVFYATLANDCTEPPMTLNWSSPVQGTSVAIALGPDDTLWKAY